MIVRSMSRSAPTFSQLAGYIGRSGEGQSFTRNLYYAGANEKTVASLFFDNYQTLPERKRGNALYHEIVVLEPQPHLSRAHQIEILQDLAQRYCEQRAPMQMAWGRCHFDTDYPHIHLMISSNEVGSGRRKRLSKQDFAQIQRDLEAYKEAKWPELRGQRIYTQTHSEKPKVKSAEGEFIRRTGKPSQKLALVDQLKTLIAEATCLDDVKAQLSQMGCTLYKRGKSWGVAHDASGKRYRLKTLGLADSFARILEPSSQVRDFRAEALLLRRRQQLERHADHQLNQDIDEGLSR